MAQFDVHSLRGGGGLVIDCQSDLLEDLTTRFVVPLIHHRDVRGTTRRLHSQFTINGQSYVMATHLAAAIPKDSLGEAVASLSNKAFEVIDALDVLISGV